MRRGEERMAPPTVGWPILHQLAIMKPTDIPTGQSDGDNSSVEVLLLGDSDVCSVENKKGPAQ